MEVICIQENVYKKLRDNTETDQKKALTQKELSAIFKNEGNPLEQSVISKIETKTVIPPTTSLDVLKAYAHHFNVTTDYLLGLRDTQTIDENIAMISKATGLSENAIYTLKSLNGSNIDMLNFMLSDRELIYTFLDNMSLYVNNTYQIPCHYDSTTQLYVPNEDTLSEKSFIASDKKQRYIALGKKQPEQICGQDIYETRLVPVSILESHAIRIIEKVIDKWKDRWKKKRGDTI